MLNLTTMSPHLQTLFRAYIAKKHQVTDLDAAIKNVSIHDTDAFLESIDRAIAAVHERRIAADAFTERLYDETVLPGALKEAIAS
jgi:hypothetical protein